MRTLLLSDLHLGSGGGNDLLRNNEIRQRLLAEGRLADQVVLLGDALELRHGRAADALEAATPLLAQLGEVLAGKKLIYVPGNHDQAVVSQQLELRASARVPLGSEQVLGADDNWLAQAVVKAVRAGGDTTVEFHYPGIWIEPTVYATHGHYLDCHSTVPAFERIVAGVMARVSGRRAAAAVTPDEYERILAPIYAWIHSLAQRSRRGSSGAHTSANAWKLLVVNSHDSLRNRAAADVGFPAAVWTLNKLGIGPLRAELSGDVLRRGVLEGFGTVAANLAPQAESVIFGHSHRAGPFVQDVQSEWVSESGQHLINTGSWLFADQFIAEAGEANPYWPGRAVVVESGEQPHLIGLLDGFSPDDLRRICAEINASSGNSASLAARAAR